MSSNTTHVPRITHTARKIVTSPKRVLSNAAFGYVRLSQEKLGSTSIERQIEQVKDTNRQWGLPEPIIFIDDGISAQTSDRVGFQALFTAMDDNYGAFLTMETGDRAFRSLISYAEFQEKASVNGIRLYNRNGPIQPEMLPIEATLSVSEIKKMRLRGEYKKNVLRRQGSLYQGPVTYGYVKEGKRLFPCAKTMANVDLIFELAEANLKPTEIVRVLKERSIRAPMGGPVWSPKQVRDLLSNPIYAGTTAYWASDDE